MTHPLGLLIEAAAGGSFPPADGQTTVVPAVGRSLETVVAFTGHAVIATALPGEVVLAWGPDGFGGAVSPKFLLALAGRTGTIGSHDVVLAATGRRRPTLPIREDLDDHPRVRHARALRDGVVAYGDDRGVVTIGTGLGGLAELSVEVDADCHKPGTGRALAGDALGLVPDGQLVIAEVAPGNARSLRAFLAAGFTPLGSAVHVVPGDRG